MEENKLVNDVSLPDLRDSDEVYSRFIKGGKLSIYIQPKHKKHIRKFYNRHKTFVSLNNKSKSSQFAKYILFAYAFWTDIILSSFEPKHEGYLVVTYILRFFWYHIDHMEAEDIDENNVRITFIPRT